MKQKNGLVPLRLTLPTWAIAVLDARAKDQHKTRDEIANDILMEMLLKRK